MSPVQMTEQLEGVYLAHHRSLRSVAWMILGSGDAADDVVQECFARLGRRGLDEIENPGAYLRRMVINECRRVIRQRARIRLDARAADAVQLDPSDAEMLDALRRLAPRRRMAVVLRYYEDLPVHEIARLMDCKPSTVSSLLNRAMTDLREVLR